MDAREIVNRIALLYNPMPDMSGQQINRLHGGQRRRVEDLAAEIAADNARLFDALATADLQIGDGHIEAARKTLHAAMDAANAPR